MDNFFKLLISVLIFVGVLFLTQFTTKYIARIQKTRLTGANIQVVESQRLSTNKGLYIVKIGQEYYALASGKDSVSVIGKLDSSGLNLPEENPEADVKVSSPSESFQHLLEKFKSKKQDKE